MDTEQIIADIKESRKYRHTAEETIRNLLETEIKKHKRTRDAVKSTRRKLHNVVASYLGNPSYAAAKKELDGAFGYGDSDTIKDVCRKLMSCHASTRERLPVLADFYIKIFETTGRPQVILDLACGLNPLSFRWMNLPPTTKYYGFDIHEERVDFLNYYSALQGLSHHFFLQDVLVRHPTDRADIALILKEVHRFEKRQRGSSLALFRDLNVRFLVVSLPTFNLPGKKNRAEHYKRFFYSLIKDESWEVRELEFQREVVFCVDKVRS